MIRTGLAAIVLLGACGVGDDPAPNNTLGRVCTTTLKITGSFAQSSAPPTNSDGTAYVGCWPIGTWTFSASIDQNDCSPAPTMLPSYAFKGVLVDAGDMTGDKVPSFSYTTDPSVRSIIKVSEAGNAACDGGLTLFSADGKQVWDLKPWMNPDKTIIGQGEYGMYTTDQWNGWDK